jgi:hypothetical protein
MPSLWQAGTKNKQGFSLQADATHEAGMKNMMTSTRLRLLPAAHVMVTTGIMLTPNKHTPMVSAGQPS